MKKITLSLAVMAIAAASCQKPEADFPVADQFTATVESFDSPTKTSMTPEKYVVWSQNDRLAIFQGSTLADEYKVADASVGNANGTFNIVTDASDINGDFSAGTELPCNVAFYPYADGLSLTGSVLEDEGPVYEIDGFSLPAEQNYAEGSFANGAFPMVAVTETLSDHKLKFKNVLGALKLQLKGTQTVKSIKVTGKNNEILSGAAVVTAYTNNLAPAITMTATDEASKSVTLNCGDGIQLSESTATDFIIALPPVLFSEGFTVTVTDSGDQTYEVTADVANTVVRSSILTMPTIVVGENVIRQIDLSANGSANCYIVSAAGAYRFTPTKGNDNEAIIGISSVEVLWETFGTDVTPNRGDLFKEISLKDGLIYFDTADSFKEGNALIAAKDKSGKILWSWHIWLTDQPKEQRYFNNAGIMMDRNIGATSSASGSVESIGLLYQWGRKDPFLASSAFNSTQTAMSTISWPQAVSSSSLYGTIEYVTEHPTTFVKGGTKGSDWYYPGWEYPYEHNRWTTSDLPKSIYDPCPYGWRVPDGGDDGVWARSIGSLSFDGCETSEQGALFTSYFGADENIWYPAAGYRNGYSSNKGGELDATYKDTGNYWAASTDLNYADRLYFTKSGYVVVNNFTSRLHALSVRCIKE